MSTGDPVSNTDPISTKNCAVTLSIVTATYNAASTLPRLVRSLQAQTDPDFEWVVADGVSDDGTLSTLESAAKTLHLTVDSRPDFGIYDALNRAVKMANGTYYIVVGADDEFNPCAVEQFKIACAKSGADFVTALVEWDGLVHGIRKRRWEWLNRQFAHVSSHAVGLAIRKQLHVRFGWYSRKLPIAADQLFILHAIHGGATVHEAHFCAGNFGRDGTSALDPTGVLGESFRAQVMVGHNLLVQWALLGYRLAKLRLRSRRHKRRDNHADA